MTSCPSVGLALPGENSPPGNGRPNSVFDMNLFSEPGLKVANGGNVRMSEIPANLSAIASEVKAQPRLPILKATGGMLHPRKPPVMALAGPAKYGWLWSYTSHFQAEPNWLHGNTSTWQP